MRREPPTPVTNPARADMQGPWSDPLAWQVTVFMGLQSFGYYATQSWLPSLFEGHHISSTEAGWLLSLSSFPDMAFFTPAIGRRLPQSPGWNPQK